MNDLLDSGPEELAVEFLSHFIDVEKDDLRQLEMTQALARTFSAIVSQALASHTNDVPEKIVLH